MVIVAAEPAEVQQLLISRSHTAEPYVDNPLKGAAVEGHHLSFDSRTKNIT
jgi:hypothetical protein